MEIRSARSILHVICGHKLHTFQPSVVGLVFNPARTLVPSRNIHQFHHLRTKPVHVLHQAKGLRVLYHGSRSIFQNRTFQQLSLCGSSVTLQSTGCSIGSVRSMAGHSKWANIRHIKAAKDGERSRITSEFSRRMRAFVRETGQIDPKTSSQLAKLIAEGKSKNIPSATIERVLAQMTNLKNASPILLEAKGPAGSVMLIEAISNKISHTRSELQSVVKKCGFSLFDGGSMARLVFEEKGMVLVDCDAEGTPDADAYVDVAIEAGAEDVTVEEDEEGGKVLQFACEPNDVYAVKKELEARQLPVRSADVVFLSTSTVPLDSSSLEAIAKAMERLEEHPDVLKVYTNVVENS